MDSNSEDEISGSWVDEEIFDPSDFDQYVVISETGVEGDIDIDLTTPEEHVQYFGEDLNDVGGVELKDTSNLDIVKSTKASASESRQRYDRGKSKNLPVPVGETEEELHKKYYIPVENQNELQGELCEEEEENTGVEDDEKKPPAGEKEKKWNLYTPVESEAQGEFFEEDENTTDEDEIVEESWVEDVWKAHLGRRKQEIEKSDRIPSVGASESSDSSEGKRRETELISALENYADDEDRPRVRKEFKRQLLESLSKLRTLPLIDVEGYTIPESSDPESGVREYRVKVHNFHLKDMANTSFANVIFLAESVAVEFAKHKVDNGDQTEDRVLDMLVHRHKIPEMVVLLHSFEFFCDLITFEVWRLEHADLRPGSGMTDNAVEMQKEKVFFKLKKDDSVMPCYSRQISGTALKKSLIVNNLPASIDEFTLRIIFPKAVQIGIAKVSRTIRSAVIEMCNVEDVWHFLNRCLELQIDHREISMKAMDWELNEVVLQRKKQSMPLAELSTGRTPHDNKMRRARGPLPESTYPEPHGLVGQARQWTLPYGEKMRTQPAVSPQSSSWHSSSTPAFFQHLPFPSAPQKMNRSSTELSVPVNVTVSITGNTRAANETSSSAAVVRSKPNSQLPQDAKSTSLPTQESKENEIKKPPLLLRALRQQVTGIIGSATKKESRSARAPKQETARSDHKRKQEDSQQTNTKALKQKAGQPRLQRENERSKRRAENQEREGERQERRKSRFTDNAESVKTERDKKEQKNCEGATVKEQKQWQQIQEMLEKKKKHIEEELKKKQEVVGQRQKRKGVMGIMGELKRIRKEAEKSGQRKNLKEEVAERSQDHASKIALGDASQRSSAQNDPVFKKPALPAPVQKGRTVGQRKQNLDTSASLQGAGTEQKPASQHPAGLQASGSVELLATTQNPGAKTQNASKLASSTLISPPNTVGIQNCAQRMSTSHYFQQIPRRLTSDGVGVSDMAHITAAHDQPMPLHLTSTSGKEDSHQKLVPLIYQPLQGPSTEKVLGAGQSGTAVSVAVLSHAQQAASDVTKLSPGVPSGNTSDPALAVSGQQVQQNLSHSMGAAAKEPNALVEEAGKDAVEQLIQQGMPRHLAIAQVQKAMEILCRVVSERADLSGRLAKPGQAKHVSDHHHGDPLTGQGDVSQKLSTMPVFDYPTTNLPQQPMFAGPEVHQPVQDRIVHSDACPVGQFRFSDPPCSSQEVPRGGMTIEDAGKLLVQQLVQQGLPLDVAVMKVHQVTSDLLASKSAGQAKQQCVRSNPEDLLTAHRKEIHAQGADSLSGTWSGKVPVSPAVPAGLQKTSESGLPGAGEFHSKHSGTSVVAPSVSSISQMSTNDGLLRPGSLARTMSDRMTSSATSAGSQQSTSSGIQGDDNVSSMLSGRALLSPAVSTALQQSTKFRLSADAASSSLARQDDSSAGSTMSANVADYRSLGPDNLSIELSARSIVSTSVNAAHLRSSVTYSPGSLLADRPSISSAASSSMQKTPKLGMLRPDSPCRKAHSSAHNTDFQKTPEFGTLGRDRPYERARSSSSSPGLQSGLESGMLGCDRPYSRDKDENNIDAYGLVEQRPQAGRVMDRQLIKDQLHRQVQERAEHLKQQMALLASLEKMPDNLLILPGETSGFQLPGAQRRDDIQRTSVQARLDIKGKAYGSERADDDDDMGGHLSQLQTEFDRNRYGSQVPVERLAFPVHHSPWQNISDDSNAHVASLLQKRTQGKELLMALPDQVTLRGIQCEPARHHLSATHQAYAKQTCSPISLVQSKSVEKHHLASFQNRISQERAKKQPQPSRELGGSFHGGEAITVDDQSFNLSSQYHKGEGKLGQKTWMESSQLARTQHSTFNRGQDEDLCHRDGHQRWAEKDKRAPRMQEYGRRNHGDKGEGHVSWDSEQRTQDNERHTAKTDRDRTEASNQKGQKYY